MSAAPVLCPVHRTDARSCACTRHSPGPWTVDPVPGIRGDAGNSHVYSSHDALICRVDARECVETEEAKANARLIAAAPDLAEALLAVYAEVRDDGKGERPYSHDSYLPGKFHAQICAALAKAGL